MNNELFFDVLKNCSYGLYILTSRSGEKMNGLIVNTVTQVTAEPPRIVVSINKQSLTHEYMVDSGVFGVTILDEDAPLTLIGRFGFKSGREVDKLSQTAHKTGATGVALVTENAVAVLEARIFASIDAGTHTVFAAEVVSGEVLSEDKPLTYAHYHEVKKGKTSKFAPGYRPPAEEKKETKEQRSTATMKKYVCDVCGYVYDPAQGDTDSGITPGTPFEALPDDWVCPVCGAGKSDFSEE